jgi:tRNA modification GTPase
MHTFVACLTPGGRAAIASLSLYGPQAWAILRKLWKPLVGSRAAIPEHPPVGSILLGRLGDVAQDEVVVSVRSGEPTPCIDIHCHGGIEVVRLLLRVFQENGAQCCSWQEFARMTSTEPHQGTIAALLSRAPTVRTASILLDQYHGAFRRAVEEIFEHLKVDDAGRVEACLGRLAQYAAVGHHLTTPWRIVVAGAPNVGKSSLVNAITGYQRCIVDPAPGTTRDLVQTTVAIDGWPLELIDTAGMHETEAELEREGIERAIRAAKDADLCLWVLDSSSPPAFPSVRLGPVLYVVNKVDLPGVWDSREMTNSTRVSAKQGTGIADLCQAIANYLVPHVPPPGASVPYTPSLASAIENAWTSAKLGELEQCRAILDEARRKACGCETSTSETSSIKRE